MATNEKSKASTENASTDQPAQPGTWQDADFLSLDTGFEENDNDEGNEEDSSTDINDRTSSTNGASRSETSPWRADLPPWMEQPNDYRRSHPLVALHNEIVAFCQLMEPMPSEIRQRERIIEKVKDLVDRVLVDMPVEVQVFGSFATGLLLPTSDIDLVIRPIETKASKKKKSDKASDDMDMSASSNEQGGNGGSDKGDKEENWDAPSSTPLQRLAQALQAEWVSELSYLELIENTRIPLVKFTDKATNISVDICYDQPGGPPAATLMKTYMDALPPLRPLTFVLKYFLAARGLNEPYSGGVGSFMLQLLIVAFLQTRERTAHNYRQHTDYNLGTLLIGFLNMYGLDFNSMTTGISVRNDGFFFAKGALDKKKIFYDANRPTLFALENPLDPSLDVGKTSFRIQMIQRSFAVAYRMLMAHVSQPFEPTPSILKTLLPVNDEMLDRQHLKKRDRPLAAKRSLGDSSRSPKIGSPAKKKRRKR